MFSLLSVFKFNNMSVIRQRANLKSEVTRKQSTLNFAKNEHLTPWYVNYSRMRGTESVCIRGSEMFVFGKFEVSLCIQSEYGKIRTRKKLFGHFSCSEDNVKDKVAAAQISMTDKFLLIKWLTRKRLVIVLSFYMLSYWDTQAAKEQKEKEKQERQRQREKAKLEKELEKEREKARKRVCKFLSVVVAWNLR